MPDKENLEEELAFIGAVMEGLQDVIKGRVVSLDEAKTALN